MNEKKGDGIFVVAFLMDEMDVEGIETFNFDGSDEMRKFIKLLLDGAPVEFLKPVLGEIFHVFTGSS